MSINTWGVSNAPVGAVRIISAVTRIGLERDIAKLTASGWQMQGFPQQTTSGSGKWQSRGWTVTMARVGRPQTISQQPTPVAPQDPNILPDGTRVFPNYIGKKLNIVKQLLVGEGYAENRSASTGSRLGLKIGKGYAYNYVGSNGAPFMESHWIVTAARVKGNIITLEIEKMQK